MIYPENVAAVVVTYNRSDKLLKTLKSITDQVQSVKTIYVIDNASTDDTQFKVSSLSDPRIEYIRLSKNIGGAGGFNRGMREAYSAGYDFIWVMDDDAYPQPDALMVLLRNINKFAEDYSTKPAFACSSVRWIDGNLCEMNTPQVVWDFPRYFSADLQVLLVQACSFVSVLIPRWAIAQHGLPIADYFIWYDDVEYTLRLSRSFPGLFCLESIVIHDIPQNLGVNFSLVNDSNAWKYSYGVRNEASYRREQGVTSYLSYAYGVWSGLKDGKATFGVKWKLYRSLLSGLFFRPPRERVD